MIEVLCAQDPTGWVVIVARGRVVAADLANDDPRVASIWQSLQGEGGIGAVIESLARDGEQKAPAFAVVEPDGGALTVLVRGSARVSVSVGAGSEVIEPSRYSPWAERVIPGATGFAISITAVQGVPLPLTDGIVRAGAVRGGTQVSAPKPATPPKAANFTKPVPVPPPPSLELPIPTDSAEDLTAVFGVDGDVDGDGLQVVEPAATTPTHELDDLFGATIVRSVEDAAVRPAAEEAEGDGPGANEPRGGSADDTDREGDHDGETIFGDELAALRSGIAPAAQPRAQERTLMLRSAAGEIVSLARPVIIGRSPTVTSPTASGELPQLVSVPGSNPDVSRNHVQLVVEGGTLVVTDLHSRNGTMCTLPGKTATRLRPGQQTPVIVGTVLDLGGGAVYTVDVE